MSLFEVLPWFGGSLLLILQMWARTAQHAGFDPLLEIVSLFFRFLEVASLSLWVREQL